MTAAPGAACVQASITGGYPVSVATGHTIMAGRQWARGVTADTVPHPMAVRPALPRR
jgi:hypothetical protein